MAQVKFGYTMADAAIVDGIKSVANRRKLLDRDIQMLAVSVIYALHKSGDKPTAVKRANALVDAVKGGMKSNALLRWFETHSPMVFNKETKLLVDGFSPNSPVKDHTKINALEARDKPWFEAIPEPEYKPMADLNTLLARIVKQGKADVEKLGDKSKVDLQQLAALEAMLAKPANTLAA